METPRDRDDRLAEDLRALRPTPRPEFTAELDQRAAAGFPRRTRLPRAPSRSASLAAAGCSFPRAALHCSRSRSPPPSS